MSAPDDIGRTIPFRDFALEVYMAKWEFSAKYNLGGSEAQPMSIKELLTFATPEDRIAYEDCWLGITETLGAQALREVIASTYATVEARNIQTFAGAQEAIYVAMKTILRPQDHAIVFLPCYQSAETLALSSCQVSGVTLDAEKNWSLDMNRVEDALRPSTALISINFPNNPTGKIIPRAQLDELVALCRQRGIWLFSDEVYRGVELDERNRLPQVVDIYERGISLNVMTKAYGLGGLRIGWLALKDQQLQHRMNLYKHYLSGFNAAPSEQLAIIALKARDRVLARNKQVIRDNLVVVNKFFEDFANLFDWYVPEGSCVSYPRYKGPETADQWAEKVVRACGAMFVPASIYKSELAELPSDRFRVGFGKRSTPEGFAVLRNYLESTGY